MKKLIFFVLLFSACAFGQGVRYDLPPIINTRGIPIANVQISLCTGTATVSGSTCGTPAQSFTDITLGTQCSVGLPVTLPGQSTCQGTSDGAGNAGFWLSPGAYIYCLNGPSVSGQCYNLTVPAGSTPSGSLTAGAGTFTGNVTGTAGQNAINFYLSNNHRFIDGVKYPCTLAGINSAYADLPPSGGIVSLGCDVTVSSGATITPTLLKPIILDLNGRTVTFSQASGVGLTLTASNINNRDNLGIFNGAFLCSAAGNNTTALEVSASTNVTIFNVSVKNCNGTGQTGILLDDAEETHLIAVSFENNTVGLQAQNFSNNSSCHGCSFNGNVLGWRILDTSGFTFDGETLTQSNTGQHGGEVLATNQNITNFNYINSWLENNGDGTANARHILFSGSGGHGIQKVTIAGNTINGLNGAATEAIELSGTNAVTSVQSNNNTDSALASIPLFGGTAWTGFTSTVQIGQKDANTRFNVGLASTVQSGTGYIAGMSMFPPGAAKCYTIGAGYPSANDGTLLFQMGADCETSPANILFYSSGLGVWELPTQSGIGTALAMQEGTAAATSAGLDICYGDSTAHAQKCSYNGGSYFAQTQTIGSGTATMTTAAIAAGACGTTVTVAATGVATTDAIIMADNAAVAANPGVLIINKWPTSGNVNFNYCNPTAASVTPSAATLNWRVVR